MLLTIHHHRDIAAAREQDIRRAIDEHSIVDHWIRPHPPWRQRIGQSLVNAGLRMLDQSATPRTDRVAA
ncbi:MAG: hypothetical protein OEO77_04120 [Acidimicrobiia bacterium]|nr:hypothetical protein [Acidimicrobiia bacterium]